MSHAKKYPKLLAVPALQRLGLNIEQIELLATQGFIHEEVRRGRRVFRLHYRDADRRQRAVNIPAAEVTAIMSELSALQSFRQVKRRLVELDSRRRQLVRDRKEALAPLVAAEGFKFHGRTIRVPRCALVRHDH